MASNQGVCGQGVPASTQVRVAATNSSCVSGGNERTVPSIRRPGWNAQRTSGSSVLCLNTAGPSRLSFFDRSVTTLQISALERILSFRSCHFIVNGARCQSCPPGNPVLSALAP